MFTQNRRNKKSSNFVTLLIGKATGKHTHTSTRTKGATDAPIAKPYREQTDWGIIFTRVDIHQSTYTD